MTPNILPRTAKAAVSQWHTVCSYVAICPNSGRANVYDVEVQIGKAGDLWYVRTIDEDVASDTDYKTREWAKKAAKQLATTNHEGGLHTDAQGFLDALADDFSDEPDGAGLFSLYSDRPLERFSTWEQAESYQIKHHLKDYQIRCLVEGDWVPCA